MALARTSASPDDRLQLSDDVAHALVELKARYRFSNEELAEFLRCPPDEVGERYRRARDRLSGRNSSATAEPAEPPPPVPPSASTRAPSGDRVSWLDYGLRALAGGYLVALIGAVIAYKAAFVHLLTSDPAFTVYGLVVSAYIISRFGLSLCYRPAPKSGIEPTIAVVMPGFNEEAAIEGSLLSLLSLDYPAEKLEIVAVNDGSTDGTLTAMRAVATDSDRVRVISFPENRGKRAAMAAGIRGTTAELVVFVDSDSTLEANAMRRIVDGFADAGVGAVCGHAEVQNVDESWLTRMQAVRYYVAFRVVKAAESVFGAVTCCSGCFSAYRRAAILPRLEWWENQRFLGLPSTFGDDRSLTNCVLRDWKVRYQADAVSHTIVPATFRRFMRQQLRWKRSWTRESLIVSKFIWRKHPVTALATYVGILLPLAAPLIALRAVAWQPLIEGSGAPLLYLTGIYAMAAAYGLYYVVVRDWYSTLWVFGVVFCFFYVALLIWQTYYAIATARSVEWGTRPATAGAKPAGADP